MLDQSGEMLRLIGHHGLGPAVALYLQELPVEHESVGQVLQTGEPSLLSNVRSRPALSKIPIPAKVTHSAAAPIRAKGTVVGLLGIAGTKSQPFTREDIALLSSIADHIGIAIENDRLQKQAAQIVVIEERERLARDLHDSVTQSLFSLTLFAATARELVHNDQLLQAEQFIDDIASTANQTHKEMRLLLYELQPSVLAREGLVDALRQRLDAVESRSGIDGQLSADLNTNLPTSIEAVLFKVANEALNNTLKHANADKVLIKIEAQETQTRMEITDNGTGFQIDSKEHKMGMGLTNMKQRMMSIGGTFDCRSSLGEGTTITVSVEMSDQTS